MTQEKLQTTVSSVEAPWPRRYERELREVYEDENLPRSRSRESSSRRSKISGSSLTKRRTRFPSSKRKKR